MTTLPVQLSDDVVLRLTQPGDGPRLATAYDRNREHLAPWDPLRPDEFYEPEWQERQVTAMLAEHLAGRQVPLVLEADDGEIVGRLIVSNVVRGALESASLGYWVDAERTGQGLMSAAVAAVVVYARDTLGLHRLEASTLLHNAASQAVLERNGFERYGMAPQYLHIAGRWQDHLLFQRILRD